MAITREQFEALERGEAVEMNGTDRKLWKERDYIPWRYCVKRESQAPSFTDDQIGEAWGLDSQPYSFKPLIPGE